MILADALLSLAAAEPGPFWTATVLAAMFGSGLFARGFGQLRRARLLEDVPTSRVRSAAQGYVELHGHARLLPGPEIRSPLSAERCCWWQYKVERRQDRDRDGRRRSGWVTVDERTSDELFLLDDGTGRCVIDPTGARVVTTFERRWRGAQRMPNAFPRPGSHFGFGEYRYTERLLQFGEWLYAIGHFRSQTAVSADDEAQDIADLLASWKRDRRALLQRFDADGNGEIDLSEWERARQAAFEAVRARQAERPLEPSRGAADTDGGRSGASRTGAPSQDPVSSTDLHVLAKPDDRRPFILSTRTEQQLTRGMRWGGGACVGGGLLLGAVAAFLLLARGLP